MILHVFQLFMRRTRKEKKVLNAASIVAATTTNNMPHCATVCKNVRLAAVFLDFFFALFIFYI